jgi:hypothetical protein
MRSQGPRGPTAIDCPPRPPFNRLETRCRKQVGAFLRVLDFAWLRRHASWQMNGKPFEEVAIASEPPTIIALGRERKMLASNNLRNSLRLGR